MRHATTTEQIIGAAYEVWNELGFGFLESVYEKSLIIALRDRGLDAESQAAIAVRFRGKIVGDYIADLVVEEILVELKSVKALVVAHEVQLVNYLVATGKPIGLLLNFGPDGVEVKRKHRLPKA